MKFEYEEELGKKSFDFPYSESVLTDDICLPLPPPPPPPPIPYPPPLPPPPAEYIMAADDAPIPAEPIIPAPPAPPPAAAAAAASLFLLLSSAISPKTKMSTQRMATWERVGCYCYFFPQTMSSNK